MEYEWVQFVGGKLIHLDALKTFLNTIICPVSV